MTKYKFTYSNSTRLLHVYRYDPKSGYVYSGVQLRLPDQFEYNYTFGDISGTGNPEPLFTLLGEKIIHFQGSNAEALFAFATKLYPKFNGTYFKGYYVGTMEVRTENEAITRIYYSKQLKKNIRANNPEVFAITAPMYTSKLDLIKDLRTSFDKTVTLSLAEAKYIADLMFEPLGYRLSESILPNTPFHKVELGYVVAKFRSMNLTVSLKG